MSCPFGHGAPEVDLDYTPIAEEPLPTNPPDGATVSRTASAGSMGTMRVQVASFHQPPVSTDNQIEFCPSGSSLPHISGLTTF